MTRKEYQRHIAVLQKAIRTYGKKCAVKYSISLHMNKNTEIYATGNETYRTLRSKHSYGFTKTKNGGLQVVFKHYAPEVLLEMYNTQTLDGVHRKDIACIHELELYYK